MAVLIQELLAGLVEDYHSGQFSRCAEPVDIVIEPGDIERILATCILSSNWLYSKALIGAEALVAEYSLHVPSVEVPEPHILENYLRDVVRCRYPAVRAHQLYHSFCALRQKSEIFQIHGDLSQQRDLRSAVVNHFPGLGLKQASMFLRDSGMAMELAIVDVHIIWFMKNVESQHIKTLTAREYIRIEDHLRTISEKYAIPMGVLDSIIWILVRLIKKSKKESAWEMQYALPLVGWTPQSVSH